MNMDEHGVQGMPDSNSIRKAFDELDHYLTENDSTFEFEMEAGLTRFRRTFNSNRNVQRGKFADRLNKLFETTRIPGRGPYTTKEVVNALTAAGHPISGSYLSSLRTGRRTNPSDETVTALAKFFQVKHDYFLNDIYAAKIDHDLELLTQLQGYGLRRLSSRAFDLSEESRKLLESMQEKLHAGEHMPEIPEFDDLASPLLTASDDTPADDEG